MPPKTPPIRRTPAPSLCRMAGSCSEASSRHRGPRQIKSRSIALGHAAGAIDHERLDGSPAGGEPESQLVLQRGEEFRVGPAVFRRPLQIEIERGGELCAVNDLVPHEFTEG